ncbi:MAG: LSM domain-containing protein [Candidatus Anstonellales archaeon]
MTEKRPFDLLNSSLNKTVIIGLKEKVLVRGIMVSYDVHMNIVLEKAELLNEDNSVKQGLGKALIRGDNIVYISPSE